MNPDYSDLLHLPRHISTKHPPMSINNRAAQFAPYAALVGHKDIIAETEHLAATKTDIDRTIDIIPTDEDTDENTDANPHRN